MTDELGETAADSSQGEHAAESYCPACNQSYAPETEKCPADGAKLVRFAAHRDEMLGRVLDERFQVLQPLGKGGMGTVYRALQMSVDREVAIKVIHPKLANDRQAAKRFLREARLASRLNQPNIVNVIDFGQTDDGVLYLVMELLRGRTVAAELGGQRRFTVRRTATIALQLCDALEAAHAQGIIHRDLKPGNIVILDDPPGRDLIKVLDFGLAKSLITDTTSQVTNTNAIIGTPLYMSPEQVQGKASDQRGDLYSLGCILYELLTGAPPFVDSSVNLILARHMTDPPAPLPVLVPPPLRQLIERLLAKDPDARVQSAGEARVAVQAVIEGGGLAVAADNDTVPDIASAFAATADVSDIPPALAPASTARPAAPAVSASRASIAAGEVAPRRSRAPLVIGGLVLALGGVALALALGVGRGHAPAGPTPSTSGSGSAANVAPPAVFDASMAPVASSTDAALAPVDAPPSPVDAADRRKRDGRPSHRTVDAAPRAVRDAPIVAPPRTIDAEPQVDFVKKPKRKPGN